MKTTTKNQPNQATPGFSIQLTEQTDLGIAMLIAEDDDGGYLPIGPVSTIAEGREIAQHHLCKQMSRLACGQEPFCPAMYKVWAHGLDGHAVAAEFSAGRCTCKLQIGTEAAGYHHPECPAWDRELDGI